jgi:predicted AAA+ superfamily ATPase
MLFLLRRFSYKVREQDKSPKKVYSIDTGLANTVGFRFSEDLGRLAENIVFLELKRKALSNPNFEIFYWKNEYHKEVDFVIKDGVKVTQLIQVCFNISEERTKRREIGALIKAMNEFELKEGIVLTEEFEAKEEIEGKRIVFLPLWKWLIT